MSQVDTVIIPANPTGLAFRTLQNGINQAFNTNHKGSTRPDSVEAGSHWIDDSNDPIWDYNFYDGTDDIKLCIIDTTNNIVVLDNIELRNTNQTVTSVTSTANATTIDLNDGAVFEHTTTENTTFSFLNPVTGKNSGFKLFLNQDGVGRTITWPGSVIWGNGTAPDVSIANQSHILVFETIDNGTTWYGALAVQDAS